MLKALFGVCALAASLAAAQAPADLRSTLLHELKTTHNQKEWFVPVSVAVAGLTPQQASWTDGKGNHSVGQLANHLLFWNRRVLAQLKGEKVPRFSGNNDETFNAFDAKSWTATTTDLDAVLTSLEQFVTQADVQTLQKIAPEISNIAAHNAYHTGEMIVVRKAQGVWNPENGVK
ncbi:MAG TPA: DinB family protein [Bryobacteraceae bacterium]|jgi:uncharacterized damage-inducible protein DinB|nr:DinB family protein [Bryobacteraceae bacterium]